jgi:tetratricopeptide (TPR) repeat protein
MASSYIDIANQWFLQNETSRAEQVYQMANGIWPEATAHNALALIAYDRGHFASAASHWKESLVLDPAQADVHRYLGEVAAHQLNDPQVARFHLQRAGHLNPQLKSELEIVLRKLNRQQARPAAETQ